MNKYAKAIIAAVLAGAGAYQAAQVAGSGQLAAVIQGIVTAIVTGLTVWGVPNAAAEVEQIGKDITGALPPSK